MIRYDKITHKITNDGVDVTTKTLVAVGEYLATHGTQEVSDIATVWSYRLSGEQFPTPEVS